MTIVIHELPLYHASYARASFHARENAAIWGVDFIHPEAFLEILVPVVIVGCIAYDIGSVSPAWFAAKARGIDLRMFGSGALDFANAWMVLGDRVGALVFIADFLKAQLALGLAWYMSDSPWIVALACVAVVGGEMWPVFHGFWGGGRGTASTAGALLGVSPMSLVICATIALLVTAVIGRRDHAELLSILLLPAVVVFVSKGDIPLMSTTVVITALLLWKRKELVEELLGIGKE